VVEHSKEHENICDSVPVTCPNACDQDRITRKTLADHMLKCRLESVPCRYNDMGCKEMVQRKFWALHMKENRKSHMELMRATIKSRNAQSEMAAIKSIERKAKLLKEKLDHINEEVTYLKTKM